MAKYHKLVVKDIGDPHAALLFDNSYPARFVIVVNIDPSWYIYPLFKTDMETICESLLFQTFMVILRHLQLL